MTTLRNRLGHLTIGIVLCVAVCGTQRANSAELYTFEAPQFMVGETTPLLNDPPIRETPPSIRRLPAAPPTATRSRTLLRALSSPARLCLHRSLLTRCS
jgi:hypothetical protein